MSNHHGVIGYDEAQAIADDVGGDLRPTYSGDGTVGQGCLGMVTDDPLKLMFKIGERGEKFPLEPIVSNLPWADAQLDGVGLKYIVYWPGIEVQDERAQLAEDDRAGFEDVRHSSVGASGWGW